MERLHKTTILLPKTMYARLSRQAKQRNISMGELIRRAVEAELDHPDRDGRLAAVERLAALSLPVGTPGEMKAESVEQPGELP